MTKRIEVYFKNEDDVEAAHASLHTLKISDVTIEEMPEGTDTTTFLPFYSVNAGSSGMTNNNFAPYGAFAPMTSDADNEDDDHQDQMTHLLRFSVADENYNKTIEVLNKYDCYVAK